jgi:hypothetical protein
MADISSSGGLFSEGDRKAVVRGIEARAKGPAHQEVARPHEQESVDPAQGLPYRLLKQRHPDYRDLYWKRLRALYAGGQALFGDRPLFEEIFPKHRDETQSVYLERQKCAFYTPYAGEIIDHIVAALFRQPLTMTLEGAEEGAPLPPFYEAFVDDTSIPGGPKLPFQTFLKEMVLGALETKWRFAMVDLPKPEVELYVDRAAQEAAGGLSAYALPIDPECVIDWECDEAGELVWALMWMVERRRMSLIETRDFVTEKWTYYTRENWVRYEYRHHKDRPPTDSTIIPLVEEGTHTHGRVPLEKLEVSDGLWAMGKLEGLAVEHFNKRSALAWAERQSLLPELYEFIAPPMLAGGQIPSDVQTDQERALNQPRGQGFVQVRASEDKAAFVGPDPSPFQHAAESCRSVRDEMHRVTHQMALTVDNTAAALTRSGDSKAQDKAAEKVILAALGQVARAFAIAIFRRLSVARGEMDLVDRWRASGLEKFESVQVDAAVEQALSVDLLQIESPTFRRCHRRSLCRLILSDDAKPEDYEKIDQELEENIPDEWQSKEEAAAGHEMEKQDLALQARTADAAMRAKDQKMAKQMAPPRAAGTPRSAAAVRP